MGFLSPWLLGGLAAVGLPIYFHLLRQHKSTPLKFSSLMFFERSTQSSIKHRRLRYLLLMALRIAVFALLAIAFAGPYIMRTVLPGQQDARMLLVVVDNSFSMREGDHLERAKQEALDVISDLPEGNEGQVAALGGQLALLTQPTFERGELVAAVSSIEPADGRGSFGELARALRAMAETAREPIEVHLFSDMQRSALPSGFADLQLPAEVQLVLHGAAESADPNFAVENVIAPGSVFDPENTPVQASISGYGTEVARRTVSLVINDRVVDTRQVDVPANSRATAEFSSLPIGFGFNRCEVRIDSDDQLPGDDRFLFAAERADPREVLFVHEQRDSRSLLYFRTALDAASNAAFRLRPVTTNNIRGVDPSRYAAVVLSDVGTLPSEFEQAVRQYVRAGGAVLVAAGPATAGRPRTPVLDQPVIESSYASRSGARFYSATVLDPVNPSLTGTEGWEEVKFYQAVRTDTGDAHVAARLSDGTPLLVESRIGEGRGILFASTFDNVANDLPLHPLVVPFVQQTLRYLGGIEQRTSNVPVGSFVELRVSGSETGAVEVVDPDGGRPLSLDEASHAETFQVSREGFYEFRRPNNRNEMVAVNPDRRESDLAVVPQETLALWQNTGEVEATGTAQAEERRRQSPLGWYVLLMAMAVLLAESVLASRYLTLDRGAA